jgi:hypothetical protein
MIEKIKIKVLKKELHYTHACENHRRNLPFIVVPQHQ